MRVDRPRRALGPNFVPMVLIVVSIGAMLTYGYVARAAGSESVPAAEAAELPPAPAASSTTTLATTTTTGPATTTSSTTTLPPPPLEPPDEGRYIVPATEAAPDVKQLAVDVAYWLTTYGADDDLTDRLRAVAPVTGIEPLAEASAPLTHAGSWSRGEVVYPQLGGITEDKASVMVVVRQTVGSGSEAEFTVVRTLDVRLVLLESVWRLDFLASAGGVFDDVDDLELAHAVANDPRIEMPDSARLDILEGRIAPDLLQLMADIADQTPYGVTVLATGHPHNVFETERRSHHTIGRAIDIYRVGSRLVVDDREPGSETRALVDWLLQRPDVLQVGSPWDVDDDPDALRSFTNLTHQDHIHVAVGDLEEINEDQ